MTKEEMYRVICQEDERVKKNKTTRNLKLFFGSSLIFFIANIVLFKIEFTESLLLALVCGILYFFSGLLFWVPFITANNSENSQLEKMKKEYQQTYNETWY